MNTLVSTYNLTKAFGDYEAVSSLNLHVPEGAIYGFLGRNGAGKTTTMKMLLGLTQPTSGTFSLFGKPFHRRTALKHMGSLIEQPSFYGHLSGRANLEIVAKIKEADCKQIDELLKIVNLDHAANKLARSYSLGMKQRLGLAMALLGHPRLLILDEPTNGLDPAGIHEMRELICRLPKLFNTTVMVSSHILSEIEQMADVVGIINQGKLIFEGPLDGLQDKGQLVLRCTNPGLAGKIIHQLAGVSCENLGEQEIAFPVISDKQVQDIITQLVGVHRLGVSRLEYRRESLESIFLRLTTEGIR